MDKADIVHCSRCGAKISPGKDYCSNCGAQAVIMPKKTAEEYFEKDEKAQRSETLMWARIMITAYGGLALIAGLMMALMTDWYVDMFDADSLGRILESYGLSTKAELIDMFRLTGSVAAISGALALVSALLCFLRKYNLVAVIICAIASLANLGTLASEVTRNDVMNIVSLVFVVIVGFVAAFLVYRSKDDFVD